MSPVRLSIQLERDIEEPLYRQLIRHIRSHIESGDLPQGTRLPASRELARTMHISRISVVNAYAELRAEGYLSAHAGRGTFVASPQQMQHVTATPSPEHHETATGQDHSLRELMRLSRRPDIINFSTGTPPEEFYPMGPLKRAIDVVLARDGASALGYEDTEGYAPLRFNIRDYLQTSGIRTHVDNVLITGGAQQAVDLIVQALVPEGQTILVASPTYLGIIDIAHTRRLHVVGVDTDEYGMCIDELEAALTTHRPSLIYVMPEFQNPTGRVMPLPRRRQLLQLAHQYRVPVLEDAVYREFRFEGEPILPLRALDEHDNVLHVGAFTKMLIPGMRIGYLVAGNRFFDRLVRVKASADISTSGFNQRVVHYLLQNGILTAQLQKNNITLCQRRDAAVQAAATHLPAGTHWQVPQGGLYLWVSLPRTGPTAAQLFTAAIQKNVGFAIGSVFYTNGCGQYSMRLNYGLHSAEVIDEGIARIGRAWRELASDYSDIETRHLL